MKLPAFVISLVEEQAAAEYPQLYSFLNILHQLDYFTKQQWQELCKVRTDAIINHGVPRCVTNLMICLFILEEQEA